MATPRSRLGGDPKAAAKSIGADSKSLIGDVRELVSMVIAYAKQETISPLKDLLRFVLWGVVGSILISVGGALLILTAIRATQAETGQHLKGDLTWVPYAGGILISLIGAVWAVFRIGKGKR